MLRLFLLLALMGLGSPQAPSSSSPTTPYCHNGFCQAFHHADTGAGLSCWPQGQLTGAPLACATDSDCTGCTWDGGSGVGACVCPPPSGPSTPTSDEQCRANPGGNDGTGCLAQCNGNCGCTRDPNSNTCVVTGGPDGSFCLDCGYLLPPTNASAADCSSAAANECVRRCGQCLGSATTDADGNSCDTCSTCDDYITCAMNANTTMPGDAGDGAELVLSGTAPSIDFSSDGVTPECTLSLDSSPTPPADGTTAPSGARLVSSCPLVHGPSGRRLGEREATDGAGQQRRSTVSKQEYAELEAEVVELKSKIQRFLEAKRRE